MRRLNMFPHGKKGKLITFCGLDGSGKTTLIRKLAEYLGEKGEPVFLTKQPTERIRSSGIFRSFMDTPDAAKHFEYRSLSLLAAADRIEHANRVILPELEAGKTVICDRYFYSCLANLIARGYGEDAWIYEIAESIPMPDYAIFAEVDADTAIARVLQRPEEKDRYIDLPLQQKLHDLYLQIAEINQGIVIHTGTDEAKSFDAVLKQIA